MANFLAPFSIKKWLEENRSLLKPPIGNKTIFADKDFIVMAVGGPNSRKDYHINEGAELFFQLEGRMCLKTMQGGKVVDIFIEEGEVFQLPPNVPHSPQRFENTLGIVIERKRLPDEKDGMQWYCDSCNTLLYEAYFPLKNIEEDLKAVTNDFTKDANNLKCSHCGEVLEL